MSLCLPKRCAGFRAHADPVNARRDSNRPIGFNGNFETNLVHRLNQRTVELQQRFSTGENDEGRCDAVRRAVPLLFDRSCQGVRRLEHSTIDAIRSDEIGVAELTDRFRTVFLAP